MEQLNPLLLPPRSSFSKNFKSQVLSWVKTNVDTRNIDCVVMKCSNQGTRSTIDSAFEVGESEKGKSPTHL